MPADSPPQVAIGLVAYNEAAHLDEALAGLAGQTYPNFRLVVSDDCSADRTPEIARSWAERDGRIIYHRNERRLGQAPNYEAAFHRAVGPESKYYCWAAGHDVHEPRFLEALVAVLEADPQAVLAYPLTKRIGDQGEDLNIPPPVYDSGGLDARQRVRSILHGPPKFGDIFWGLYRVEALRRVGVHPRVILPDPTLLTMLSLDGPFRQVQETLWLRRYKGTGDAVKRQKKTMFPERPWYTYLPWPLVNALAIAWQTALKPAAGGWARRRLGLLLAAGFFYRRSPFLSWMRNLVYGPARSLYQRLNPRTNARTGV